MFKLIRQLFGKKLSREAFEAYFYRLPESIVVSWFRDGNFIIGTVKAEGKEFTTQGRNAEEFIEMVNDAVLTVYEIPNEYLNIIKQYKTFTPPPDEIARLGNKNITKSKFGTRRNREVLRLA